jgi:broad specificity phosphatase PhoE
MQWLADEAEFAALRGAWSLLLRHADRPPIPPGEFGDDLEITDQGRRRARALGVLFGDRLIRVVSSPVRRCVGTAEAILSGAGIQVAVERDCRLGDPGPWIVDARIAGEVFRARGTAGVVEGQLAGHCLPGMRSLHAGTTMLLDLLVGYGHGDGVSVMVTHDSVIAPFVGHLLPSVELRDVMPRFLEGPGVRMRATARTWAWRGRHRSLRDL